MLPGRKPDISAAGAVVLRPDPDPARPGGQRVLVVHRPSYDDWSLPKGKIEPGESAAVCAVREVREETGVRVRLGVPLDADDYRVGRRTKRVQWWCAEVIDEQPHSPDDEVDAVVWLTPQEATELLSYQAEVDRVDQALTQPRARTLILLRHGKAMERSKWSGADTARPLAPRGQTQAQSLVPILEAFGVGRVVSSTANRCVSTVLPFATAHHLSIDRQTILSEEGGGADPRGVGELVGQLREEVIRTDRPLVICSHRPVLPALLAAVDLPDRPFHTGECAVLSLTGDNQVWAAQWLSAPHKK